MREAARTASRRARASQPRTGPGARASPTGQARRRRRARTSRARRSADGGRAGSARDRARSSTAWPSGSTPAATGDRPRAGGSRTTLTQAKELREQLASAVERSLAADRTRAASSAARRAATRTARAAGRPGPGPAARRAWRNAGRERRAWRSLQRQSPSRCARRASRSSRSAATTPDMRGPATPEDWRPSVSAPGTEAFKQDFARWESLKQNLLLALENVERSLSDELRAAGDQGPSERRRPRRRARRLPRARREVLPLARRRRGGRSGNGPMRFAVALPWWGYVLAFAAPPSRWRGTPTPARACRCAASARCSTALRALTLLLLVAGLLRPVRVRAGRRRPATAWCRCSSTSRAACAWPTTTARRASSARARRGRRAGDLARAVVPHRGVGVRRRRGPGRPRRPAAVGAAGPT